MQLYAKLGPTPVDSLLVPTAPSGKRIRPDIFHYVRASAAIPDLQLFIIVWFFSVQTKVWVGCLIFLGPPIYETLSVCLSVCPQKCALLHLTLCVFLRPQAKSLHRGVGGVRVQTS